MRPSILTISAGCPRCTWVRHITQESEYTCLLGKEIPVLTYQVRINQAKKVGRSRKGLPDSMCKSVKMCLR